MKIQIWEEGKLLSEDDCKSVRFDSGVFFIYKKEHVHVSEWDQAFMLRAGCMVNLVK